jgi:hypothetical protein
MTRLVERLDVDASSDDLNSQSGDDLIEGVRLRRAA